MKTNFNGEAARCPVSFEHCPLNREQENEPDMRRSLQRLQRAVSQGTGRPYTVTHHFQVAVTVTVSEEGHNAAYAASKDEVDVISSTITTALAEDPDLSATVCYRLRTWP